MIKVSNELAGASAFLTTEAWNPYLHAAQRVRQQPVFLNNAEPEPVLADALAQWQPNAPLDDTLTEMEGLARNPNATGAYAGSF